MPFFIPALISGIAGLAGGLLNRPKEITKDSTGTSSNAFSSGTSGSFYNSPTMDPMQSRMRDFLLQDYYTRAQGGDINHFLDAYKTMGVGGINRTSDMAQQNLSNSLAARGLSFSPVAGTALANAEQSRVGQINELNTSLPLLGEQMKQSRLTDFSNFLSKLPYGQQGTSESSTAGQQMGNTSEHSVANDPGNILGGGIGGFGSMLAMLLALSGQSGFGNKSAATTPK